MTTAVQATRNTEMSTYLPAIEHDETLYSWCATTHALGGNVSSSDTSHALFGNGHSPRQHDIPRRLGALQDRLSFCSVNAVDLLRAHTVGACYLPFMSVDELDCLAAEIDIGVNPHWRRRLLSPSRTHPIQHPLKFCPHCCKKDHETVGRAYWHTQHQFPASWVCSLHLEPLRIFSGSPRRWLLPSPLLKATTEIVRLDAGVATICADVGHTISTLRTINLDGLRAGTLERLRDIGVIHSLAGARHDRLTSWFSESAFGRMCTDPSSGMSALADGTWIPAHLWRQKRDHPARWIALWSSLQWRDGNEARSALIQACTDQRRTENGQYVLFESSKVALKAPDRFYDAFKVCDSYEAAMSQLQVKRGDIVRWLETDQELRRFWKHGKFYRRLELTLQNLRSAMAERLGNSSDLEGFLKDNAVDVRWLSKHSPESNKAFLGNLNRRSSMERSLF